MCAMKIQILTCHVTLWCDFVFVLLNSDQFNNSLCLITFSECTLGLSDDQSCLVGWLWLRITIITCWCTTPFAPWTQIVVVKLWNSQHLRWVSIPFIDFTIYECARYSFLRLQFSWVLGKIALNGQFVWWFYEKQSSICISRTDSNPPAVCKFPQATPISFQIWNERTPYVFS